VGDASDGLRGVGAEPVLVRALALALAIRDQAPPCAWRTVRGRCGWFRAKRIGVGRRLMYSSWARGRIGRGLAEIGEGGAVWALLDLGRQRRKGRPRAEAEIAGDSKHAER